MPARSHCELHVDLGGVDRPIVSHQVRVVGHPVHVERDQGELHVDDVVVPLLVADLRDRERRDSERERERERDDTRQDVSSRKTF